MEFTPLDQLTTFSRNFRILIRVTKKSCVKPFSNVSPGKSPGRLFTLNIIDKDQTEMPVISFNRGVDIFYNKIQENRVYSISGGYIKLNDKKFNSSDKSEYKLVLTDTSIIEEMADDGSIEYKTSYHFTKISEIFNLNLYARVDLCVYILECGECQLKNTKHGEIYIRKLMICDDSECKIELTLWRSLAEMDLEKDQFIIIKNAKVGEFNGRNISSYDDTTIIINPQNLKEIQQLQVFLENFHGEFRNVSLNERELPNKSDKIQEKEIYLMQHLLQMEEFGEENINCYSAPYNNNFKKIKVTLTQMIHNDRNFYAGCPDAACKRKSVFNGHSEDWICNYCSKTFPKPAYYYNLSVRVKDCSCEHWIDLFGSNAEKMLKITAEEYRNILLNDDKNRLKEISANIEFKTYYFLVKAKIQSFNGRLKKKIYAYKFELIDPKIEFERIYDLLNPFLKLDEDEAVYFQKRDEYVSLEQSNNNPNNVTKNSLALANELNEASNNLENYSMLIKQDF